MGALEERNKELARDFVDPRGPAVVTNSREEAIQLELDEPWSGMYGGGDLWFAFDLERPGDFMMSTAGSDFDTVLELHDSRGNELARDDDGGGGMTSLVRQRLAPARYFLKARALGSADGELHVSLGIDEVMVRQRAGMREAQPLALGEAFEGRLGFGAELWFSFEQAEAGTVTLHTIGSSFDTRLYLLDAAGRELVYDDDGGEGVTSRIQSHVQSGTYFVRVSGFGNAGGTLELRLEEGALVSPPGQVASGAGADRSRAIELEIGQTHRSELASGQRWYAFEAEVAAGYRMTTNTSDFDTVLTLYDGNGREITTDDDGGASMASLIERDLQPASYFLMVRGFGSNTGEIVLVVDSDAPPPPDGSSFTRALDLPLGESVEFALERGEERWYRIEVAAAGTYVLSTAGSDFDTRLALVDEAGNQVEMDDDDGPGTTSQITRELLPGSWYLKGYGYGTAAGTLHMRASPAP